MGDTWDPRKEDFTSSFNTYDRGPGRNLPQRGDRGTGSSVQLFITGVPREITEDGLRNLFVKAGNVLRVKKPPPKTESQETSFAFVTMSNVREAEEAIRRYNFFKIDRFTLKVKVAMSDEQKRKEQQQKQEDEAFYNSLKSFRGKPENLKSNSDTDSEFEKLNSVPSVSNGISQKPLLSDPVAKSGKGRGQVLEELSGLYGSEKLSLGQQRLPRQPKSVIHAVNTGGDADQKKTLDKRFTPPPVDVKKLVPGEMYNVEDLTITVDTAQHNVKAKEGGEVKLMHAASKPHQLKNLIKGDNPSYPGKGRGQGFSGRGPYNQMNGHGRERHLQGHPQPGGYQGPRGQREPRGRDMDRYESYTSGYRSDNRSFGPSYGGQMPMYNPAPSFSPYGANMSHMGMMGHPYPGGYPQMGPYGDQPFLLTPAPPMLNQSMQQRPGYHSSLSGTSAPHSPAVSTAEEKLEGQSCSVCEKIGNSRCGRCKTPYCSRECQKSDWQKHKQFCKGISRERDQADAFEKTFDLTVGDEMIENVKGLIEQYTGEQFEITKKPKTDPAKAEKTSQTAEVKKDSTEGKEVDTGTRREAETRGRADKGGIGDRQPDRGRGRQNERKDKTDDSVCYNCKKSGHFSRECPEKEPGKDLCHSCQKPGHFSKECPEKLAGVTCYNCKQTGHYKGDCPNLQKTGMRSSYQNRKDKPTRTNLVAVENDEASWDEPAQSDVGKPKPKPAPSSKPLAQSTPNTTPAKPIAQSPPSGKTTAVKVQQIVPSAALPLNSEVLVVVTEVVSPAKIWCQIMDQENIRPLQEIMRKMAEKYNNSQPDLTQVLKNQYCGVQFSQDHQWYRGRVADTKPLVVHFIDYGNQEKRSLTDLRQIDDDWLKHPAQAVQCYVEDIAPPGIETNWSGMIDKVRAIIASDVPYRVTAKEQKESEPGLVKYGVVMFNESNENIAEKLIAAGLANKKKLAASAAPTQVNRTEETSSPILVKDVGCVARELNHEQEISIMITAFVSPDNFTAQIIEEDRIEMYKKFSDQLISVENDPPYKPSIGELVVAKFSADGSWYRGEIISMSNSQVEVTYIDFGNSESVSLDNVRKPKPAFKNMPAQAMKCSLVDYKPPNNDELATQVLVGFAELASLASPVKLKAVIKAVVDDVVMLEVFSAEGNKSVNKELEKLVCPTRDTKKSSTPAKKTEDAEAFAGSNADMGGATAGPEKGDTVAGELPVDKTSVLGLVTEIRSNDSFYVQLCDGVEKLQEVMRELNDQDSKTVGGTPSDIKVGDFVAALFDDGGSTLWYRAKVEELVSADKVKVLYIDFGNSATVGKTTVKKLNLEIRNIPAFAIHCELLGSNGPDTQVTEDFMCILNQMVNVKAVLKKKDKYIVDLVLTTDNATSVSEVLGLDTSKVPDVSAEVQASGSAQRTNFSVLPLPLDGSAVSAVVVHVERLDLFCIQVLKEEYQTQLPALMAELQESCGKNPKPYSPKEGECVAAQFDDGTCTLWYRAKSLGQDKDKFKVEFVDYGNTENATKDMIQALDPKFTEVPALVAKCRLAGCSGKEKKELIEEFRSVMTGSVPLKIKALKLDGDVYEVEMHLDSDLVSMTNVAEILGLKTPATQAPVVSSVETPIAAAKSKATETASAGAKPKSSPTKTSEVNHEPKKLLPIELPLDDTTVKGAVVFIENLSSFFVQLHDQVLQDGLTQMMTELNGSPITMTNPCVPKIGEIVAAIYSDSQEAPAMWYRAKVEKIENNTIKVFFVDYGNTEQIRKEEVKKLSDKFLNLPQMAVRCQLPNSQGVEDAELLTGFACILNQPMLVKALKKVSVGYEIDLITDGGMSVAETLGLSGDSASVVSKQEPKPQETAQAVSAACKKTLDLFKLPLDGSEVSGAVMAIESLQLFHVQILDPDLEALQAAMMIELQEYCGHAKRPYQATTGEVVGGMFTDGGETLWYRARVQKILNETKQYVVFFVDYGNTEIIQQNDVCQLDVKFLEVPQGSVPCKLLGSKGNEDKSMVEEFQLVLKVKLNVKAVEYSDGIYTIELYLGGININEQLGLGLKPISASPTSGPVSPQTLEQPKVTEKTTPPKPEALPRKSVSPQHGSGSERKVVFTQTLPTFVPKVDEFEVTMTSVTTPDLFHAQILNSGHDYLTDLALQTHRMMMECESELGQDDIQFEVGELVCAKFTADNSWYRASILKLFPDKTAQVEYVDYGNVDIIPLTLIRPVTNDYIELPRLAFKCKLSGVYPVGTSWSSESSDKLKTFLNRCLLAKRVAVHKDVYELKMTDAEKRVDVGETLVKAGVASKTPQGASGGQPTSPRSPQPTESLSDTERLQRENEIMKQQLAAMQAQMAELLKQKN